MVVAVLFATAQQPPMITIHGHVFSQETGAPIKGQSVIISIDSLQNNWHYNKVVTDSNGVYTDFVPYMYSSEQLINVYTYDCRGAMVKGSGYFHSGKLEVVIDLTICGDPGTKCEAFFKFSPNPNNSLEVAFFDGSRYLPSSEKISYLWNFGDSTISNVQNPIHTYTKPGIYNVCLRITSGDNFCSSAYCFSVAVGSPAQGPCDNSFWYYTDSVTNQYTFNGLMLNGLADTWKWDFGDGTTATGQTVIHLFAKADNSYKVCLTTTGAGPGATVCTASSCQEVFVHNPSPCESSFLYYPDSTGSVYTFEGYAKNNQVSSWSWDFGDGTTASGQKVSHSFIFSSSNDNKGHSVCLTTTGTGADGVTCTYNSCKEIYPNVPSPCENFFKAYSADGFEYTFSGSVASGAPASYYWDFGDGNSDTGQVVTHAFGKIYTVFNVCLTTVVPVPEATGFAECKSISCQSIYNGVDSSWCKAVFSAIPANATRNTFHFANLSQGNHSYIYWEFGDGSHSTETNPLHTYLSPGLFIACLTVGDSMANCMNTSCQEIWVDMIQPSCQASFTVKQVDSSNTAIPGYMFFNTSAPGYTNLKWSFGDGTVSTDVNPIHIYSIPGVYTACLTIGDSLGKCHDTYCMDIYAGKVTVDNTVSGIVMAGNKVADQGIVWLVSPDNTYNDETQPDSAGIYHFTGVPSGKYYIYAMLTPGSDDFFTYLPTYYASSLTWQGATLITTGDPNAWYKVSLVPSVNLNQGNATITGTINWGSMIVKAENNPAANVEVMLYNNAGDPVAYTFTDSNGTFIFEHLPYGSYTLQAQMTGRETESVTVSLSEDNATETINFIVNEAAIDILGTSDLDKSKFSAGNPYPNPAGEILNLIMNASASGSAVVDIMDIQGRVIHTETIALKGSNNLVSIGTGSLTKGIYLLRIKSDGYKPVIRKFIR